MKSFPSVKHLLSTPRRLRAAVLAGTAVALMASGIALAAAPSGPLTTGTELFSGKGDQVRAGVYGVYGRFDARITSASTPAGALSDRDKVPPSADSAKFTFDSVNQDGIHQAGIYRCHLNRGGGTKICLSGKSYSDLRPGHYTFKVWDLRSPGRKATLSWTVKRSKRHEGHHGRRHGHGGGHGRHATHSHGHGHAHGHQSHRHPSKPHGHESHGHGHKSHGHKSHGRRQHGHHRHH